MQKDLCFLALTKLGRTYQSCRNHIWNTTTHTKPPRGPLRYTGVHMLEQRFTYIPLTLFYTHKNGSIFNNPNTIKSYKILQKLSPKHAAHGVAQSTYPIYRHGKACLSKQPPWRAAGDPSPSTRQVPGSSPGSGGRAACAFFLHPPFLPPSGDSLFAPSPPTPQKC